MVYRIILLVLSLSGLSVASAQTTHLNLNVLLEGPFDISEGLMSTKLFDLGYLPGLEPKTFLATSVSDQDPYVISDLKSNNVIDVSLYSEKSVDWVRVVISNEDESFTWAKTLLIEQDGQVVTRHINDLRLNTKDTYYITVYHRNHLPVKSTGIQVRRGRLSFDFSTTEVAGVKHVDGVYLMRGGQLTTADSDLHIIDMIDIDTWTSSLGQNSSYLLADIDMDGDVSVHDKSIILSNLEASLTLR